MKLKPRPSPPSRSSAAHSADEKSISAHRIVHSEKQASDSARNLLVNDVDYAWRVAETPKGLSLRAISAYEDWADRRRTATLRSYGCGTATTLRSLRPHPIRRSSNSF